MGNINYDSFYKFLVSLGLILVLFPFTVILYLFTDSFNLQISEADLSTYTETAQRVIRLKQSIPLLLENQYVFIFFLFCVIIGISMMSWGLIKWYKLQQIEDISKKREYEKTLNEVNKNVHEMSDEEIISKSGSLENTNSVALKYLLIEQKFFNMVKLYQPSYLVKHNIIIGRYTYDVVAFSNQRFKKDYIYEVKYAKTNISISRILRYIEQMEKLKNTFSETFNRIPYMVLAIIVPDSLYEFTSNVVHKIEKRNNYSIKVLRESELPEL